MNLIKIAKSVRSLYPRTLFLYVRGSLILLILFAFQGKIIFENPLHIILIAVPLTI
jgi:ACR3 family arsenite transporter